jgi:hypothetical protein
MIAEAFTSSSGYFHDCVFWARHCEERSDEAIHRPCVCGLLRGARHRARIRATRWLAMTGSGAIKTPEVPLAITVFIRYQLDPFKRAMFEQYAKAWLSIIPKCGGDLVGYWMPHEGTNNIAFALISFESLAAYESYRAKLRADQEGLAYFNFAEENKFILAEERTFLRPVML